jgi:amino acid adenylation domain-containing protein
LNVHSADDRLDKLESHLNHPIEKMSHLLTNRFQLPPEQEAIRAKCFHPTGTFFEFKREETEQPIPQRFETIVKAFPHRIAVKNLSQALTYDALNKAANRIAHVILAQRDDRQEPILLLLNKGPASLSAILGALKSNKVVIAAEPSLPMPRINAMLQNSQAKFVLTDDENLGLARNLTGSGASLMNIDDNGARAATDNPQVAIAVDALAFIFYTSGSTGEPKGVSRRHRDVLHNAMTNTNVLHISPDDRWLVVRSFSTGGAINDSFSVLLNGGASYAFDINKEGLTSLVPWLIDEQVTIYSSVATVYRHFVDSLSDTMIPSLRIIYLGGEQILKADFERYTKHFDNACIFVNRIGMSETGTISYYFADKTTSIPGDTVPTGYPAEDTELLLLDENGREVGLNEVGEIAVRSRYLSPGYWRSADLTNAKFLPDPTGGDARTYLTGDLGRMALDGCVINVGRKDFRTKVRGYKVEVTEVERALLGHSKIKEAVVVARQDRSGNTRLVGYCVPTKRPAPTISELRLFLKETLPDYMVPSAMVIMDAMPLAPSGKIDRKALPDPSGCRPELGSPYIAPRTIVEQDLAEIWAAVLSLDRVGIHDNFFDLGGHSLAATRIVSQVIKKFRLEIPLQSLFQSPTIAEMTAVIAESRAKKLGKTDLRRILTELESLSDEDAKKLLADQGASTGIRDNHE